ncbi:ATP-dependent DNA helicase RecG [Patescibacteria group bacterium]|nr:ATP-dependent DNA helicase RecG [Patescibacteria group bacterium]
MSLDSPISSLPRVSPAYQKRLLKLGIKTLRDLFFHLPRRYDDFSKITKIIDLRTGATATVQGRLTKIANIRTWKKRMNITEAFIQDNTGIIKAIWFNQPYLTKTLKDDDLINVSGKIYPVKSYDSYDAGIAKQLFNGVHPVKSDEVGAGLFNGVNLDKDLYFSNPAYEKIIGQLRHTGRIVPIYPETAGLSSRYLRYIIQLYLPNAKQLVDWLPAPIKRSQHLVDLNAAISQVHFPASPKNANQARRRLAFEELFLLQTFVLSQKFQRQNEQAQTIPFNKQLIQDAVAKLPFELTLSQKKAAWEVFQDLAKTRPMNRLLEGDVGSGKTVVAALAALANVKAGCQTAFMAPTEILARQHFKTLSNLLADYDFNLCLLTSADTKEVNQGRVLDISKKLLIEKIKNGQTQIVIGTHALIQKQVSFKNLTLAVVDEQHRFGVAQRAALQKNIAALPDGFPQKIPHLLSMTATPIPRTLALTLYGDLDLSLLTELPQGRQKILTHLVPPIKRAAAYNFIRQQIKQGRQAFVVCPRIDLPAADVAPAFGEQGTWSQWDTNAISEMRQSSMPDNIGIGTVKAVKAEYEKLSKNIFPDLKIALLHGKIKSKEKEKIMADFSARKIDILVATSVIEVGLDIPNAAIMMIEGAERFGLAQLHQLRGRVGRSAHQSYCLLFTDSASRQTQERLKIMATCRNGFELAEKDLQLRGPGEFFGTNQSGLPDLSASLLSGSLIDLIMVKQARGEAAKILRLDPELKNYPLLKDQLQRFQNEIHLE